MNPHRPCIALLALAFGMQACDGRESESTAERGATSAVGPAGGVEEEAAWFTETAKESGLDFRHRSGQGEVLLIPEIMCGGVALIDVEGDGDLDVYLVQGGRIGGSSGPDVTNRLYENDGRGNFRDITERSGSGDARYGIGVASGDHDGDGDPDLLVTNLGRNTMFRNEGDGIFTDVTESTGLAAEEFSSSASFFDMDGDGDLDLYVCNYLEWSPETEIECRNTLGQPDYCAPATYSAPASDRLYRNRGDGVFEDVSLASGIAAKPGTGLGVAAADFDGDGRLDLFVANDGMPDLLWMNQGDGTFIDEAARSGCALDSSGVAKAGMGVAIEDLEADGDQDLLVCNLWRETDSLFLNDGKGRFVDATARRGLAGIPKTFTRFGLGFRDFDQDGYLDLFQANGRVAVLASRHGGGGRYDEPNLVFRGSETRFKEVRPRGGTADLLVGTSRGAAFGDLDDDGDVDVVVVNRDGSCHLLRNDVVSPGHWIGIRVLDATGGDAIGAMVEVVAGDRRWRRQVRTDGSYLSASDPRVHVGIGSANEVDPIRVTWPDGTVSSHESNGVDRLVTIRRGLD